MNQDGNTWGKTDRKVLRVLGPCLAVLMIAAPVNAVLYSGEVPFVRERSGYIFYAPTINHAETSVASQAPSGIIPLSPESKIATSYDLAGKLLELTAAYKYTSDRKYLDAIDNLYRALKRVENTYGFIPEILGLDGLGYSVYGDQVLHDAMVISDALLGKGEIVTENVTAVRTVENIASMPEEEAVRRGLIGREEGEATKCPYRNMDIYGEVKKGTKTYICTDEGSATFTVKYSVDLSKLGSGHRLSIRDITVRKVYEGKEVDKDKVVSVDEGTLRGIKIALLPYAREDMLNAIAREYLLDPEFRRGFETTSAESAAEGTVGKKLGFQARELFLDEAAVPWNIVRYGQGTRARIYEKLLTPYSLYKGAAYIEFLVRDNGTVSYEFRTGENLNFTIEKSGNIEVEGTKIVYTNQGAEPRFEGIRIKYRPVAKRRIKIAGAFDALLTSRFGGTTVFQGGEYRPYDSIKVADLPSGVYDVKVFRKIVLRNESLEGKALVRKPTDYAENNIVVYTTNELYRAHQDFYDAIKEKDPVKLYVAADNLWMHSNNPRAWGAAKLAMKAMLSLDERDFEEFARRVDGSGVSYADAMRAMQRFKEYYAERIAEVSRSAVRASLEKGEYSPELEKALQYIALEANRTGLETREELSDLYSGYKAYFGPHTKDYENLKLMARHMPEYKPIVDAIESGDYERAKELIQKLPEGDVKNVFMAEVSAHEKELEEQRQKIIELTKAAITATGDYRVVLDEVEKYREMGGETNGELTVVEGVARSLSEGTLSPESAKKILSSFGDFAEFRAQEMPEEREEEKEEEVPVAPPPSPQHRSRKPLVLAALILAGAGAGLLLYSRKKEREEGLRVTRARRR